VRLEKQAQALQALAVGQIEVQQHGVDARRFGVQAHRVLQGLRFQPVDGHLEQIAARCLDAQADQFMVVDEQDLAARFHGSWGRVVRGCQGRRGATGTVQQATRPKPGRITLVTTAAGRP